jgi:transcriptional regulator with XRE-family HTH domain
VSPFCKQLRARGRQLELSDAAIARRLGISQSRYTNYVNGHREPDFAMLARICRVLHTTPNELLGFQASNASSQEGARYLQRVVAAAQALSPESLRMAAVVMDAIAAHQTQWAKLSGKKKSPPA